MKKHISLSSAANLTITISPATVNAANAGKVQQTMQNTLVITVFNAGKSAVDLRQVAVQVPASLATSISPSVPQNSEWDFTFANVDGVYIANPIVGASNTLEVAKSYSFTLDAAVLNQAPNAVNLAVKVMPQNGDTITKLLPVTIQNIASAITSYFTYSSEIDPGGSASLQWTTVNIDHVIIEGVTYTANNSVQVNPQFTHSYTLYAYAAGIILAAQLTVTVKRAEAAFSLANGLTKVDYGSMAQLTWDANQFTQSVTITCDDDNIVFPESFKNADTQSFGPITSETTFLLTCFDVDSSQPNYQLSLPVQVNKPVITLFKGNPMGNVWALDEVTLTWEAESTKSITINAQAGLAAKGSLKFNPDAPAAFYTITATGAFNGQSGVPMTTSYEPVIVTIQALDILTFECNPYYILPANNAGNQASLFWATEAQVVSIDNGIGVVNPAGNKALTAPADGTVYNITISTKQTPLVTKTQQTVVHNGYGPFVVTSFSYSEDTNITTCTLAVTEGLTRLQATQSPNTYYGVHFAGIAFTAPGTPQGTFVNNTFLVQSQASALNNGTTPTITIIEVNPN